MKDYVLMWFTPSEGRVNLKKYETASSPRHALFNFACEMILTCNTLFNDLEFSNIQKNILTGKTSREHYWIEFKSGEVLSIMECISQTRLN